MVRKPFKIRPEILYLIVMLIQLLVLLLILWPFFDQTVFLLYLFIVFSIVLRWRISIKPVYMLIDQIIFILISLFYPAAVFCLFIFAYYFSLKNKLLYLIPLIFVGAITPAGTTYYILILQAILFGIILHYWENESNSSKDTIDHLRQHIYDLESIQVHLLSDYQDTEKISRLTERQRIAEILHDNLGHELTAAHLSLKAYKTLIDTGQLKKAEETLNRAEKRLENGLEQLKDSVNHIEPAYETGPDKLSHLCENFIYHVDFKHSGDLFKLKPYIWQLILMTVKEGLTNITKHAEPTNVSIFLEVTDYIVRFLIENDGLKDNNLIHKGVMRGNGLRYIRRRLEAINGSLSIQKGDTFKLIIIIPIQSGR
ncbi:MAG TPA: histidine kinase [Halanaerobiales bacterium]|nr:histidine kinase [Halanaerobiales bacterium]